MKKAVFYARVSTSKQEEQGTTEKMLTFKTNLINIIIVNKN